MTWQLTGSLRFVRYDVDAQGRRSLQGYAKGAFTLDTSDPRNSGFESLVDRLPGARFQRLPLSRTAGALTNLLSQWQLHCTTAAPPWPAGDPLSQAVAAAPEQSHVAADLLGATPYRAAMTVRILLPLEHFDVVFGLFQQSLASPRVRYVIGLADPFRFPEIVRHPGTAGSARDLLAGASLLLSPARIVTTIRPPRRSGATRMVPPGT